MTNRLPYETTAGLLSPKATFEQLIEYLRLCEEDARVLNGLRRQADDELTASGWVVFANNFNATRRVVSELGKAKTKSIVGYRNAKPN